MLVVGRTDPGSDEQSLKLLRFRGNGFRARISAELMCQALSVATVEDMNDSTHTTQPASDATPQRDWDAFISPGREEGQRHLDLAVDGMTCAACMIKIERGMKTLPGVTHAHVNLSSKRLAVEWEDGRVSPEAMLGILRRLGYRAHPFDPARVKERATAETKLLLRALGVSGFAAMNVMLLSISIWAGNGGDIQPETRELFHWISALIALPASFYAGRPFFRSAWGALRHGGVNMDVPISIGVMLALLLSVIQTVTNAEDAYYESALMLLFFLLVGRFLDQNMRVRTHAFAENLAALRAETALKLDENGTPVEVPLSKVKEGDQVLVRAGERVSVDGRVVAGQSEIDQSLVTGETDLAKIQPGSDVFAGTMNMSGALTIQVRAAASGTLLDEVNRLIENAMQARSRYVRLADRAATLYAPLVHTAAALTFLAWWVLGYGWQKALVVAISTLIITCPCALGLAIPAVQVVASGVLFKRKILLNSADAIERLADVDHVMFDKTGTLTLPEAGIANLTHIPQQEQAWAASLAAMSKHPLAQAVARLGDNEPLLNAEEIAGAGMQAVVNGVTLRLGSPAFCGAEAEAEIVKAAHPYASLIAFRHADDEPVVFAVEQMLRPGARETIEALKANGLSIGIISGDHEAAVARIAGELGVTHWQAGLKPAEKINALETCAANGSKVLMVGDGLNDAPALAAAHVSLSPVTAVHLSQAAADCIFLGDDLQPVVDIVTTGRKARQVMRENLAFATLYNVIAVPFAVLGFVTPLIAALAMSGSSILVTVNSLRARTGRKVDETMQETR